MPVTRFLLLSALLMQVPVFADNPWESLVTEVFKSFEGRWEGSYELRSQDGRIIQYLQIEYQYWLEDGVLKGLAVFNQGDVLSHSKSRSYLQGNRLISEVEESASGDVKRFVGTLKDQSIVWIPMDPELKGHSKIKETVVVKPDKKFLLVEGYESVTRQDQSTRVLFSGLMELVERQISSTTAKH